MHSLMRSFGSLTAALVIISPAAYAQVLNPMPVAAPQPSPATGAPANWPAHNAMTPAPAMQQPAPAEASPAMQMQQAAPAPAMQMQPAPAAQETIDSVGSGAIPALPLEIMTSGGVVYVSGGIGDEELEMLKAHEHEFNVRILMSGPKGAYVSEVLLRILDNKGTPLVQINDAGPYVYARMMPGAYTLETAAANGEKKTARFTVGEKGIVREHLVFNE